MALSRRRYGENRRHRASGTLSPSFAFIATATFGNSQLDSAAMTSRSFGSFSTLPTLGSTCTALRTAGVPRDQVPIPRGEPVLAPLKYQHQEHSNDTDIGTRDDTPSRTTASAYGARGRGDPPGQPLARLSIGGDPEVGMSSHRRPPWRDSHLGSRHSRLFGRMSLRPSGTEPETIPSTAEALEDIGRPRVEHTA